ncbi:MAG: electron transfer flavoprotein subunit alpha/FixB family protein, partial [Desulfobacterales bacterium]
MAAQVFAYIVHKNGVADDTALELISAARNIFPDASPTAITTGAGADLDAVCNELSASFAEVWKFDHEALAYPNAEAIRKLLVAVLPID